MTAPTSTLLMTGATRGFGRLAAEELLRAHPEQQLVVAARGGQGAALAADLAARSGNPHVSFVDCDLASLASIRSAVAEVTAGLDAGTLPPLHGVLANAGLQLTSTAQTTADGFELTFGVNVLANVLLLGLLAPRLVAPARIVVVASDVHFGTFRTNMGMVPAPRWTSVAELAAPGPGGATAGRRAYATSKLGVIYLVHALARRLPAGVDVYSYNPGLVPGTGLARDAGAATRLAFAAVLPALRATPLATSPAQAGALLAAAAAGPRPAETGSYIDRGRVVPSSNESYNSEREDALWREASRLCDLPV
jgi:NAD(P)-dependent dehydrogenase (short-subunit alcohol dehydrogenase family)